MSGSKLKIMIGLAAVLLTAGCVEKKSETLSPQTPSSIWNGQIADPRDPTSLAIVGIRFDKSICTGVIIGKRHILTAQHCVGGRNGNLVDRSYEILFGENFLRPDRVLFARRIDAYTPFDWASTAMNDIAVVELGEDVPAPYKAAPLAGSTHDLKKGDPVLIHGFGTWALNQFDGKHRQTQLKFERSFNNDRHLALRATESAACQGDSGGGAFRYGGSDGRQVAVIGVFSFLSVYGTVGNDCSKSTVSSYVNVEPYLGWIRSIVPDAVVTEAAPELPTPSLDTTELAFDLIQKLPLAGSDEELKTVWQNYERASGLESDYNSILERAPGTNDWTAYRPKIKTLAKRMALYHDRFAALSKEDRNSLAATLNRLTPSLAPDFPAVSAEDIQLKFCMGYLPAGAQGPERPTERKKIEICLDQVALSTANLRIAAVQSAVWNQLMVRQKDNNFNLVYAWMWSHGIAAKLVQENLPDLPYDFDPTASVLRETPFALAEVSANLLAAQDSWKFITSLNLNIMMSFMDSLGLRVVQAQLIKGSAHIQDLALLPYPSYEEAITQALRQLALERRNPPAPISVSPK